MALDIESRYPGQSTPASADYPYGSGKNVSAPSAGDGTPWEKDIYNDIFGFLQGLLTKAGITPNGNPDTAIASQYLQSVLQLFARRYPSKAALVAETVANYDGTEAFFVQETGTSAADGFFVVWRPGNQSAAVTADPVRWFGPNSDPSGANGAYQVVLAAVGAFAISEQALSGGETAITVPLYTPGLANKQFEYLINGVRQSPATYAETNSTTITLSSGAAPGTFTAKQVR